IHENETALPLIRGTLRLKSVPHNLYTNPCRNCDNFCSLFPTPYSLLPTPYSLFPVPCSLFPLV
ncbi:hypothetical protein, partial [Moorena sp. SIO3I8]|uniref:hypothetical protein n=1 Tax=Moorena sp. SIO3I8 TaxID=2607833 RepID=UPI0025E958A9